MKRFPILPFFFIFWLVFFILTLGWSIILRLDYSFNEIVFQITHRVLLIDVLISYGLAVLLTLYKMIPYPQDDEKKDGEKKDGEKKKAGDTNDAAGKTAPAQADNAAQAESEVK